MYKKISLLFLLIFSINIWAADNLTDFKSFKISSLLAEMARLLEGNEGTSKSRHNQDLERIIQQKLFGKSYVDNDRKSLNSVSEQNPLFKKIYEEIIGQEPSKLGQLLAGNIIKYNEDFSLGETNYSGFNWQKPMGNFSLYLDRNIIENVAEDNHFIITDTFSIVINAHTLLEKLKEDDLVEINDTELAAFAGINYRRTYTYTHYATGYQKALTADYSKLFLSFFKFQKFSIYELAPYEILSKRDFMSAKIGGMISNPPMYGVSVAAGILSKYKYVSQVDINRVGEDDDKAPGEYLRIDMKKEKTLEAEASARLYLDFFKLLKITLLAYDISYGLTETDQVSLSFYENDLDDITSDSAKGRELGKILKLKKVNIEALKPNVIKREYRKEQTYNSKYSILIMGGKTGRSSETIDITADGVTKKFYKYKMQTVRYDKKIIDSILDIVFNHLFSTDTSYTQYRTSQTRRLNLEYKGEAAHVVEDDYGRKKINVRGEENISLVFYQEFKTRKTRRWKKSKERLHAIELLNNFTTLEDNIVNSVESNEVKAPLQIVSNIRVEKAGIMYLNQAENNDVKKIINNVCNTSEEKDRKIKYCIKKLNGLYLAYRTGYDSIGSMNIPKLKSFLYYFMKYLTSKKDLQDLFGEENIFLSGSFNATTPEGQLYNTYFKEGIFRGVGVIDKYRRKFGVNSPVSIFDL